MSVADWKDKVRSLEIRLVGARRDKAIAVGERDSELRKIVHLRNELHILRMLAHAVRERESLLAQEIADQHKMWKRTYGDSE